MGFLMSKNYWFFSSQKQIEVSKANEINFINICNNFLEKIKINKDNVKLEFLNRQYK